MRRLAALPLLFVAIIMVALPCDAEARRMGYGGNMGRQYSIPQRSATAPSSAPRQGAENAAATAPRPGGASRWLGPVAGLLAGGLLASLFFGGAFEGIQLIDILLLVGGAALVFFIFRAMRPRPAPAQLRTADGPAFDRDETPVTGGSPARGGSEPSHDAPAWFKQEAFLKNARTHFIRLQAAWDKGDMKDIAEYTTPEMFASLQSERLSHGGEQNYTEVVYLDAELLGMQRDGEKAVASIRFFGGIREEQNGPTEKFSEVWHVVHAWDSPEGDWYVAGIQQHVAGC